MSQKQTISLPRTGADGDGWSGLLNSLIGFVSASTIFGLQQFQNAFSFVADPREGMNRVTHTINSLSNAMVSEASGSKQSAANDWNRVATEAVDSIMPGASGQETTDEDMSGRKS